MREVDYEFQPPKDESSTARGIESTKCCYSTPPKAQFSTSRCLKEVTFPPKLKAAAAKTLTPGRFSGKRRVDRTVSLTRTYKLEEPRGKKQL